MVSHGLLNTGAINVGVRHAASPGCHLTGFGDIMMTKDEKSPSVDGIVAKPVTAGELQAGGPASPKGVLERVR
jgi:hypothetical protein